MAKKQPAKKAAAKKAAKIPAKKAAAKKVAAAAAAENEPSTPAGVSEAIGRCTDVRPIRLLRTMSYHAISGEDQLTNLAVELDDIFTLDITTEVLAGLLIDEGDPTGTTICGIIDEHRPS